MLNPKMKNHPPFVLPRLSYSSTTLYYTILLQYYSVLQSTIPVLLCTTKYYSSTSLYYKVLLQYYSVLQSTTPVLLQYYSSTTLYYSWLIRGAAEMSLQHHQILRLPRKVTLIIDPLHTWNVISHKRSNKSQPPTSANTAPATQNDSHDQSATHMKRYLQCAQQLVSLSKLTKYCACHEKWISWLILVTHETLFTMRGATSVIVQTHQRLRLPRKTNLMIDPCHTWNAIYNARNNRWHPPTSPNTASATQNDSAKISAKFLQNVIYNARPIRDHSENDPSRIRAWNRHSATRLATEVTFHAHHEHFVLKNTTFRAPAIIPNFTEYCACHKKWHLNFTKYCACHAKWISWLISMTYETLFTMRGTTGGILQHHQILRLPRKMTLMINPRHTWNAIYNARNNRWHPPTSPNTAPATPNDSPKFQKHFSKTDETSITMRDRSETIPSRIREWNRHPQPASQPRLLFTPTTGILYWKIQRFALRLSFQISPNTAPATKSDTSTSPNTAPATKSDTSTSPNTAPATKSDTWTSPNNAPATKSDTWTSPNNAPATKSDTWTSPNSAPATKSYTWTSPNSDTNLISYESLVKRI